MCDLKSYSDAEAKKNYQNCAAGRALSKAAGDLLKKWDKQRKPKPQEKATDGARGQISTESPR